MFHFTSIVVWWSSFKYLFFSFVCIVYFHASFCCCSELVAALNSVTMVAYMRCVIHSIAHNMIQLINISCSLCFVQRLWREVSKFIFLYIFRFPLFIFWPYILSWLKSFEKCFNSLLYFFSRAAVCQFHRRTNQIRIRTQIAFDWPWP